MRVIIVDDSATSRAAIAAALDDPRIEVVASVSDALEGLEAIGNLRPDVVTLDVHMPGLGGLEVLREIRAQKLATGVVIVSVSQVGPEALDLGADRLLAKPSGSGTGESTENWKQTVLSRVLEVGQVARLRQAPLQDPVEVVVVDDSRFQRKQVCRYFEARGLTPREAGDVKNARRILESLAGPALVLVDLNLPEESGLALIAAVRTNPALAGCRAVVMSCESRQSEILRCVEAGAEEYLMKPFDADTLFAKLRHLFGPQHAVFGETWPPR